MGWRPRLVSIIPSEMEVALRYALLTQFTLLTLLTVFTLLTLFTLLELRYSTCSSMFANWALWDSEQKVG